MLHINKAIECLGSRGCQCEWTGCFEWKAERGSNLVELDVTASCVCLLTLQAGLPWSTQLVYPAFQFSSCFLTVKKDWNNSDAPLLPVSLSWASSCLYILEEYQHLHMITKTRTPIVTTSYPADAAIQLLLPYLGAIICCPNWSLLICTSLKPRREREREEDREWN